MKNKFNYFWIKFNLSIANFDSKKFRYIGSKFF